MDCSFARCRSWGRCSGNGNDCRRYVTSGKPVQRHPLLPRVVGVCGERRRARRSSHTPTSSMRVDVKRRACDAGDGLRPPRSGGACGCNVSCRKRQTRRTRQPIEKVADPLLRAGVSGVSACVTVGSALMVYPTTPSAVWPRKSSEISECERYRPSSKSSLQLPFNTNHQNVAK